MCGSPNKLNVQQRVKCKHKADDVENDGLRGGGDLQGCMQSLGLRGQASAETRMAITSRVSFYIHITREVIVANDTWNRCCVIGARATSSFPQVFQNY